MTDLQTQFKQYLNDPSASDEVVNDLIQDVMGKVSQDSVIREVLLSVALLHASVLPIGFRRKPALASHVELFMRQLYDESLEATPRGFTKKPLSTID